MLQDRKIRIHPPLNTVLRTRILAALQPTRRDLPGDAFLPAHVREVVDGFS